MKKSDKSSNGTSFHNTKIKCSVNDLKKVLGEPTDECNDGKYKTNFEWNCENDNGDVVTIYDWKEYRKLDLDEKIEWHLGGNNKTITERGKEELLKMFGK